VVASSLPEIDQSIEDRSLVITTITQSVRQNLTALCIYLENVANSIWGHAVRVTQEITGNMQTLTLSLDSKLRDAPINEVDINDGEWSLMKLQVEDKLPLNVTAWAKRLSPLACSVLVQVDRPGLEVVAGRILELTYADRTLTSNTDDAGIAHFEPVPIAAVPSVIIRFIS
jgi:hypothetical protein